MRDDVSPDERRADLDRMIFDRDRSAADPEKTVLAMILADNSAIDMVGFLDSSDFLDPTYQEIFDAMRRLRQDGRPINLATLKHERSTLVAFDGRDIVGHLRDFTVGEASPRIVDIAKIVHEAATRRMLVRIGESLTDLTSNYSAPLTAVLAETVQQLDTIGGRMRPAGRTVWTLSEAVSEHIERLQNGEAPDTIRSGLRTLDAMTGEFRTGEYWILAGRPSMGKSSVALSLALGAARAKRSVLKFSLEMPAIQLAARATAEAGMRAGFPVAYTDAVPGRVDPAMVQRISDAAQDLHALPMVIDEQAGLTVSEIAARVRTRKAVDPNLGLVIVDHLGKIRPSGRYKGDRNNEVTEMSNALAEVAKKEAVCMLVLSQLNRSVEGRDNKRPQLSDLRDSGSLEQDADVVMFAYRPAYYLERTSYDEGSDAEELRKLQLKEKKNTVEIGVAKNRNGRTGSVELFIDLATNFVADLEQTGR